MSIKNLVAPFDLLVNMEHQYGALEGFPQDFDRILHHLGFVPVEESGALGLSYSLYSRYLDGVQLMFPRSVKIVDVLDDYPNPRGVAFKEMVTKLTKMGVAGAQAAHVAGNWPDLISTAPYKTDAYQKGAGIYQITIPVRELTEVELNANDPKNLGLTWEALRRKKGRFGGPPDTHVWIAADAEFIEDSDILAFISVEKGQPPEVDFVYDVPSEYITYLYPSPRRRLTANERIRTGKPCRLLNQDRLAEVHGHINRNQRHL